MYFSSNIGVDPNERAYDPRWFTLADMATARTPSPLLVGSMSGAELVDIYHRWVTKGEICVVPVYKPADVEAQRSYRVALHPDVSHQLSGRERNLRDVEAGPFLRAEDLWEELFGR